MLMFKDICLKEIFYSTLHEEVRAEWRQARPGTHAFIRICGWGFEVPRLMMIGQFESKERSFGKSYRVLSKSTHKRKALGGSGNC